MFIMTSLLQTAELETVDLVISPNHTKKKSLLKKKCYIQCIILKIIFILFAAKTNFERMILSQDMEMTLDEVQG